MIPESVIDEIRSRVDIVAVIGRHMELKKSGRTWKGCCVFHGERTPSFHVYPEDRHFKCYGCGEYGDVFKFLQRLQGKEFPEIVRALAVEVGVAIPEREEDSAEQRRRRQERAEALAACDAAARYFAARLWSRYGEAARRYLSDRGVAEETARRFRLGIASPSWDDLPARLSPKGISEDALERAGLVVRRDGRRHDTFAGRLIVPISAADGEVIAFGGRLLPGAPDHRPKYINSIETALYKKSRVLYGLDQARERIRRTRSAVLVEGYFDVIGLHEAGVANAVAVCGTALTPEHLDVLRRLDCRALTLLFDGDEAGVAAAHKAAAALLPSGLMGKVALLPRDGGKLDPDEFARSRGAAAVEALIAGAVPLTEYLIERAVAEHLGPSPRDSSYEQRMRAFEALKGYLDAVPPGLAKSVFEERVAERVGLDRDALARAIGTARPMEARPGRAAPSIPTHVRTVQDGSKALDALGVLASFPALAEVALEEHFLGLYAGLPTETVARDLLSGNVTGEQAAERLAAFLPAAALARFRALLAEARPDPESAEREFRKATIEAKIEQLGEEIDRLSAEVARVGSPIPGDLQTALITAVRRRSDLEKRRDGRRPG